MIVSNALRPLATGVNLTAGVASTSATIPNNSAGVSPKFIRVAAASGASCHVRIGKGAQTAVATDLLVVGSTESVILNAAGCDTIAVIQEGTGGIVTVTPLDWDP